MSSYSERLRDYDYMAWVKTQACVASSMSECEGVVTAHHAGERAFGRKAPDRTCIPLCDGHHRAWHDALPPFRGLGKVERSKLAVQWIAKTQIAHERYERALDEFKF